MQRSLLILNIILILTVFGESKNDADYYSKPNSILKNNNDLQMATAQSCRSLIPFSFDISTKLTAAQFKALKSFLFRPFLSSLFPVDIQPAPFSTYSEQNHGYRRPNNVSDIVNFVNNAVYGGSDYSFITRPLKYFVDQNVVALATADLAVNIIIFAGNSLAAVDVQTAQSYASTLTANGNTLTVVLVNPNIDQTNYRQVPGLNIVVWSDFATLITNIKNKLNCHNHGSSSLPTSTATSSSTTSFTFETTQSTTPIIPAPTCRSYIPFSFDVSTDLSTAQFADLKTFLVNPFLESVFPKDIQPLWYSSYDQVNFPPAARPLNVSDIITVIPTIEQTAVGSSSFTAPLLYFLQQNVVNAGSDDGLFVNTVIFAGSALSGNDLSEAQNYVPYLTQNGNTVTVVLVNPNIDQTNYLQISNLNIVVWSDPQTTIGEIVNDMNCPNLGSSSSPVTSTVSTSIPSSSSTSTVTTTPTTISTTSESTISSSSTTVSSTSPTESTTTTPLPPFICRSYIPFSFDVSTKLSADQYSYMKNFIVNSFLEAIFPIDIRPAVFSTYSDQNYAIRRQANVSNIINFVTNENQGTSPYSFIALPLKYFVDQNVVGYNPWTNVDIVNTVVFAGDSLAVADVPAVKNYTSILTANGNTLTVVLVNPNIDQTNYRNVTGLNIVVWSNPATTIATILSFMNCPFDSSSTATSTSTESTTSPSSTSTTTVTSTSTAATPPTSTSTITSTVVTSPSTSETTTVSTMSTTTTPPIPVCKSYIPFSSDVATDLTATQFVELRTFLVNLFLSELFPLDVQPAWYSTYDTTNHGYDRPYNVSDVINNVQNLIQSTATTSDFIQPLQYFVDQNVPTLGSTNGLPVNSIIFAGSPLNDVDTANFYAPSFTSNGNTLTVVLVNPNINQKNYRNVTGLNIVVWSDPQTTIAAIRAVMNCEPSSSTST